MIIRRRVRRYCGEDILHPKLRGLFMYDNRRLNVIDRGAIIPDEDYYSV